MIPTLSEALAERGFDTLTDVQLAVTDPALDAADLLVSAQTGSGKTVGFGLAIAPTLMGEAERLGLPGAPLALVVAPTRELALQVQRELNWLYAKAAARVVSCIGGMDAREERRALERGAHIVVGTPGRLRDHITRGNLDLSDIRAIVLDEADEMLDLGFREDLEFMLGEAPAERRTLLFSATVPPAIAELAKTYQRDAVRVTTLSRGEQHADIAYQVVQVAPQDVENAIINLLRYHDAPTAIVFANTRATVARLAARLSNRGLAAVSLSGELSQTERTHALQAMRDGRARVCVATDVAARGIDLPNLDLVIHADLPTNTEGLLHRSGRTGRAGRKGISALVVPDKALGKARRLLGWAKISAEMVFAPAPEDILARDEARLLADPLWSAEPTAGEAAFAASLMAQYAPEQIAAACLRLYRSRLSAPEDLNTAPARAERAPFGPSAWVSLSVGHDRKAEPRWLLPLLCRAGGLEKGEIGRIRVMSDTTLVEVAEAAAPGLFQRLGPDGLLEEGITARPGQPPADGARAPARPERSDRPERPQRPARPERHERHERPERSAPVEARPVADVTPAHTEAPVSAEPRPEPAPAEAPRKPRAVWKDKPATSDAPRKPRPAEGGPRKPYAGKGAAEDRPRKPYAGKPAQGDGADRPRKPYAGKGASDDRPRKPYAGKSAQGDSADRPRKPYAGKGGSDDRPRKPYAGKGAKADGTDAPRKPYPAKGGKPRARTEDASAAGKPAARARPNASDPSQRMDRKGGKPRTGKPSFPRKGGAEPPRRKS